MTRALVRVPLSAITVLLAVAVHPAWTPTSSASQGAAFHAGVDLVSLNVTVADAGGRFVADVRQNEFSVFEDGVQQDITFFNHTNLPIALAILLDTSASMEDKLPNAQEAAIGFVRRLRPQDLAEIVQFDTRVVVLQNFTSSVPELERAIRRSRANGSTALYSAVSTALKDLKGIVAKRPDEIRRRAIVLLTDGEDTSSLLSFAEVLDLSKRSETAIYAVGLRAGDDSGGAGTRAFKEAQSVLRQLAQETGGRSFFLSQVAELSDACSQIAEELSSQYTLGYTSRNTRRDGGWRRLAVRVNRPNIATRSKQGYFAPRGAP